MLLVPAKHRPAEMTVMGTIKKEKNVFQLEKKDENETVHCEVQLWSGRLYLEVIPFCEWRACTQIFAPLW